MDDAADCRYAERTLFNQIAAAEKETKESLIDFEHTYPCVTNGANVNDMIRSLQERKRVPLTKQRENEETIREKKTARKRNEPGL